MILTIPLLRENFLALILKWKGLHSTPRPITSNEWNPTPPATPGTQDIPFPERRTKLKLTLSRLEKDYQEKRHDAIKLTLAQDKDAL